MQGKGNSLRPIVDHCHLARTPSGAVINIDAKAYKKAITKKQLVDKVLQNEKDMEAMKEDIASIKDNMVELINILKKA